MPDYNLSISSRILAIIEEIAERKTNITKGEVIRRALATYAYLTRRMQDEKRQLALINEDGSIHQYVELP